MLDRVRGKLELKAAPQPEVQAEPTADTKTEPTAEATFAPTEVEGTPQLVKRVLAFYEERGRVDVQAIVASENAHAAAAEDVTST